MHIWDLSHLLPLASDTGQVLLLLILISRRLYRVFPIFTSFVMWELASDALAYAALAAQQGYLGRHYVQMYYLLVTINYLFEFIVLLEIASNVLQPAKQAVPRGFRYLLLGIMLVIGLVCFWLAVWINPTPFANMRYFLVLNTAAAILCVVTFVLISGFSQILGLSWKNHVLQLTTGLAFYSVVELVVELVQSQLRAGPDYLAQYQFWGQIEVIGYLCTLSFWCYAFLKKEAPRKEFSPQMAQVLVLLSGGAKRQHAVLARSRDD